MSGGEFQTVADELLTCALHLVNYFRQHGYTVYIEKQRLEYPSLPTLELKRKQTKILIEVGRKVRTQVLDQWVSYGISTGKDTRIGFASDKRPTDKEFQFLNELGIGFYLFLDGGVVEQLTPRDLGINIRLPELDTLNVKLRRMFAPVYEKIERSYWVEAFEDACKLLEEEASRYLIEFTESGRIKVMTKDGPKSLTVKNINNMTIGQLAHNYTKIVTPTAVDVHIGDALTRINKDRVLVTHKKGKPSTARALRKNVGSHMWVILGALKQIR
jgi:hypothetical protein